MIDAFFRLWQRQRLAGDPRIFVIGFNKCGTKTLHGFFCRNLIRSAHCNYTAHPDGHRIRIATTMRDNVEADKPILTGMTHYQAFSDLIALTETEVIEANGYFREMHRDYPDAFFILNDRPMEDWIRSRLNHEGGPGGSFVGRYAQACGIGRDAVSDLWRHQYYEHKRAVLDHFEGHDRFLHFDITRHGPEALQSFFGDVVPVKQSRWKSRGSSAERARRYGRPPA